MAQVKDWLGERRNRLAEITSGFLDKAIRKLYCARSHWLASYKFAHVQMGGGGLCDFFNSAVFLVKQRPLLQRVCKAFIFS